MSLRSCKRLAARLGLRVVLPVILPPGRCQSFTSPIATGSPMTIATTGTVSVASCAAFAAGEPATTITSTGRRASSCAAARSRSGVPSAVRVSIVMFCPSMSPRSRRRSPQHRTGIGVVPVQRGGDERGEPGDQRPDLLRRFRKGGGPALLQHRYGGAPFVVGAPGFALRVEGDRGRGGQRIGRRRWLY